jgi:pimeloyl-ACP methyl ester carboxylesterase
MLHTITKGTGQPVVLLHGFGTSHKYWNQVLAHLPGDDFKILTPDMLGFGRSNKPDDSDYSVDEHAEALVSSVLQKSDLPVVLVGHSMGAMVATRIAKLYPDLISRLILINMPLFPTKKRASQVILRNLPLLHRTYISPIGKAIYVTRDTRLAKTIPRAVFPKKPEMQDIAGEYLNHTRISLLLLLSKTLLFMESTQNAAKECVQVSY